MPPERLTHPGKGSPSCQIVCVRAHAAQPSQVRIPEVDTPISASLRVVAAAATKSCMETFAAL